KRSNKGRYGMEGFNYRIRIDYEGEMYIATSVESVISSTGYPSGPMRGYFKVYFKPSSPNYVSIKCKPIAILLALFVFVVGVIMLIGPIIFYKQVIHKCFLALLNRWSQPPVLRL